MTTPDPHNPVPAYQRPVKSRTSSCLTRLLITIIVLVALSPLIWHYFHLRMKQSALEKLSPAEAAAYETWLTTPIRLPDEWLNPTVVQSEEMLSQKQTLLDDFVNAAQALTHTVKKGEAGWRLTAGRPVTPEELAEIKTALAPLIPIQRQLAELAEDPTYARNSPYNFSLKDPFLSVFNILMLHPFVEISNGRIDSGLDALDDSLRIMRYRMPAAALVPLGAAGNLVNARNAARLLDEQTSDPLHFVRLEEILRTHKSLFLDISEPANLTDHYFVLITAMARDGYLQFPDNEVPPTQIFQFYLQAGNYARWLAKQLPADDPHLARIQSEAQSLEEQFALTNIRFTAILRPLKIRALRLMEHPLVLSFVWSLKNSVPVHQKGSWAKIDITRLWLVRRAAELRGDPLPVTQSDFVPRYLPDWPTDPHSPTGADFQFDATTGEFYSIGPDAAPGTDDDIRRIDKPDPADEEDAEEDGRPDPAFDDPPTTDDEAPAETP